MAVADSTRPLMPVMILVPVASLAVAAAAALAQWPLIARWRFCAIQIDTYVEPVES